MYSYTDWGDAALCVLDEGESCPRCPLSLSFSFLQSAHTGGCSASLAIVDGFNEFHGSSELHPPIALLPAQPAGVEIIDVLNGGQKAGWVCLERGRERARGGN